MFFFCRWGKPAAKGGVADVSCREYEMAHTFDEMVESPHCLLVASGFREISQTVGVRVMVAVKVHANHLC